MLTCIGLIRLAPLAGDLLDVGIKRHLRDARVLEKAVARLKARTPPVPR